jgi:N-acetylglucosamine kinase-like BadF-type ATPase
VTFLGIDGGGSKTTFLLESDSGEELAQYQTGPSNWISAGADCARQSLSEGIKALPQRPDVVCAGLAGAGKPEGKKFYLECLQSLLPGVTVFVESDALVAYFGAIGPNPGVLLIAGTGSIAIARRSDGTMARAGGWGPVFGDEGSGFWIGRAAINRALRLHDSGAGSDFVDGLTAMLGLPAITDAPAAWKSGSLTVAQVARVARILLDAPNSEPGAAILREAAEHLRSLSEVARESASLPPTCVRSASGSIALNPVMQSAIRLQFTAALHGPARGAILLARDRIRLS